jgi:hypothetical protein
MHRPFARRLLLPLALLGTLAGSAPALQESAEPWRWRVAPYLWTAGIDGSVATSNAEADFDVDFSDVWNNLESAGLILVETRSDQMSFLCDLVYLGLEVDGETPPGADADLDLDTTILELAGLYRFTPESLFEPAWASATLTWTRSSRRGRSNRGGSATRSTASPRLAPPGRSRGAGVCSSTGTWAREIRT